MASNELPQKQKAWLVVKQGKPRDALVLDSNVPVPTKLNPGDVLVKVQAAALNPVGYKLMALLPNFVAGRPLTAESDFSGIVANGNGTKWLNGEAVFGTIPLASSRKTKQGALSEYTVTAAENLATRPETVTPIQAAGVCIAGLTAWQCVFDHLKLEEGQHLFVYGASTSVGSFAIQFAKAKGIKVTASASGKNQDFTKDLGADEFIDYTKQDIASFLSHNPPTPKFHGILDAFGLVDPSLYAQSEKYLAPGGAYVTVGPNIHGLRDVPKIVKYIFNMVWPTWLGGVKRKFALMQMKMNREDLDKVQELLATGKVVTRIDSVYDFDAALEAYDRILTGRAIGKIVIKVDPSIN